MNSQITPEPPSEEGFAAGRESWDLVLLVEYPNRRAFLEMVQSPEYQEIAYPRTEALARGELHPLIAEGWDRAQHRRAGRA